MPAADGAIAAPDFRCPHFTFPRETDRRMRGVLAEEAKPFVREVADLERERVVAVPERRQRKGTDPLLQRAELTQTDLFVDVREPLRPGATGSEVFSDLPVPSLAVGVE